MKFRFFLFLIFIFSTINAFSQQKIQIDIHWLSPIQIGNQNQLCFTDAFYEPDGSLLPYFSTIIDLPAHLANASELEIVFSAQNFTPLLPTEKLSSNQKNRIGEKLDFKANILIERGRKILQISGLPFRKTTNNKIEKLVHAEIISTKKEHSKGVLIKKEFKNSSLLSSGTWFKIPIKKTGVHKISFANLEEMGFSNPKNVKIYGSDRGMLSENNADFYADDLSEKAVYYDDDNLCFFAKSANQWSFDEQSNAYSYQNHLYSDLNYVFLTQGSSENVNLIQQQNFLAQTPTFQTQEYDQLLIWDVDSINILESGRLWFGKHFDYELTYDFNFNFPGRVTTKPLTVDIQMAARSPYVSTASISDGQQTEYLNFSAVSFAYSGVYADLRTNRFLFSSTGNSVSFSVNYAKNAGAAEAWLDYIKLEVPTKLSYNDKPLFFSTKESISESSITEFTIATANANLLLWDISSNNNPKAIAYLITGNELKFKSPTQDLRQFVLFQKSDIIAHQANEAEFVENQNLHRISIPDLLIIAPPIFMTEAQRLANFRKNNDNLDVEICTPQQIYNEFSNGIPDAMGIRQFLRYLYQKNPEKLKYLLLFGDGSVDNKTISQNNTNYIITYQSDNSTSSTASYVSDDFFGMLDDSESGIVGLLDIGIGRFPVKTQKEAASVVTKIISYSQNFGAWQNDLCFIADDSDENQTYHMTDSDYLTQVIDTAYPIFNIKKIYLDAYPQQQSSAGQRYPLVNEAFIRQMTKGALIFNYTGHGSENRLAHENILDIGMINGFSNSDRLPVFMTATCEFSRFDMYSREQDQSATSAGELLFLNSKGGAVAMFTTTRVVYSNPNFLLNKNFYRYAFEKQTENHDMRLGDIMRLTKLSLGLDANKRNFTLFGDPSMKLNIAKHKLAVDGIYIHENQIDTVSALDKVSVKGSVLNSDNQLYTSFSDTVDILVLDKKEQYSTMGNDGFEKKPYEARNSILYRGSASVKNGKFDFQFFIPKDINYRYGFGKISLFSENQTNSASGFFNDFVVGGSSETAITDNIGPDIQLYLNAETFANGATTDENPKLIAQISDSTAVNTSNTSIGHDISLVLNGDLQHIVNLNEYYEAELDDYSSGKLEYPLYNLPEGKHQLNLKAWDINGNSSEKTLDFVVSTSDDLKLERVFNYPNPFANNTAFYFNHNAAGEQFRVRIVIFAPSGQVIKTLNSNFYSPGNMSMPIYWDGRDDFGNALARGVYFYLITVADSQGRKSEKYQKIMILR